MTSSLYKKVFTYEFYLLIIWFLCILIVNPIGDFPLNDDWSYALNTKSLVLENKFSFDDWGAMTLVAHNVWGAFFCKFFGFSFTTLRFSTLVLAGILFCFSYRLFHDNGIPKKSAFGLTLLLMFNPWLFSLSFTYMTDVPFLCFLVLSFYYFLQAINKSGGVNTSKGTIFSIVAVLIRQPGVLIPLAFFFVYILKNGISFKTIFRATIPSLVTISSLQLFVKWRENRFGLSSYFGKTEDFTQNFINGNFFFFLKERASEFFVHWGISLLPLLLLLVAFLWSKKDWKLKLVSFFLTSLTVFPYWGKWNSSLIGNVFYNLGLGPKTMGDHPWGYIPPSEGDLHLNDWNNLEIIGFISGAFILYWFWYRALEIFKFIYKKELDKIDWAIVFGFACSIGYFIFLLGGTFLFDRYYFILLPFLMLILFPKKPFVTSKWIKIPSVLAFGVLVSFSIGATKDYLEWNRQKWKVIDYAINDLGIQETQLNGGFEYNGWHGNNFNKPLIWESIDWWLAKNENYHLAFTELCGYETIKTISYQKIIPPFQESIFLLKKKEIVNLDTIVCDVESVSDDQGFILTNNENVLLQNHNTRVKGNSHSGKHSVLLNKEQEYTFTFELKDIVPCEKIWVTSWRFPSDGSAKAVIAHNGGWLKDDSQIIEIDNRGWGKLLQTFTLPKNLKKTEAKFYFYNPSQKEVWIDDLSIIKVK